MYIAYIMVYIFFLIFFVELQNWKHEAKYKAFFLGGGEVFITIYF